ncbi:hypothetical protein PGTUg99_030625 [Puccinia graminis f. sp. tritici]|uniref:Uncharacterized protein n=1 Tax=Puccinia graminis f. sp. tritici TaxID=56615 RepID=A0A5B0Q8T0_PUCGR|nr:hypothetical protein PGTUg99_030625 [Puccinia graminis f. sp. tritici]
MAGYHPGDVKGKFREGSPGEAPKRGGATSGDRDPRTRLGGELAEWLVEGASSFLFYITTLFTLVQNRYPKIYHTY